MHQDERTLEDQRYHDVLVSVEGVSKRFCRSFKRSLWYGVQDILTDIRGGEPEEYLRVDEFWAVREIGFELRRGQCLGLIGANGAGKTTLLRMMSGLIKPDVGRIQICGRAGGLIALGAGFNPVLTGRENVYVNASILGISKRETDEKIEKIIDFAEIDKFIDTPVQNYSSGMAVRLGFAIAAMLTEPDVLFLDEVLAVGDIRFTIKCLNAVRQLAEDAAVIFVSHNMQFVSAFCNRVIVMEQGRCVLDTTNVAHGIDRYFSMTRLEKQETGTGEARVECALLHVDGVEKKEHDGVPQVFQGSNGSLLIRGEVKKKKRAHLSIAIADEAMTPVISYPVLGKDARELRLPEGKFDIEVPLGKLELRSGKYSFIVSLQDADSNLTLVRVQGLVPFRVYADETHWGKLVRPTQANSILPDS